MRKLRLLVYVIQKHYRGSANTTEVQFCQRKVERICSR